MSRQNPEGFPWGANDPTAAHRLAFAVVVTLLAVFLVLKEFSLSPVLHSDFGPVWFAARAVLHGGDPYLLIGPGREFGWSWRMTYPATAIVSMLPFGFIPTEAAATTVFSAMSAFLLAWGATRDGWHRVPAFVSVSFVIAAAVGQWSMLLSASLFTPLLAAFWCAKPTIGFAILASERRRRAIVISVAAACVLLAISLILLPHWPQDWLPVVMSSHEFKSPVRYPGGFLIPLVLYRWRNPQAWLLCMLALVPQSPGVYDLLIILFAVPKTYHQSALLSISATTGAFAQNLAPVADYHAWMMFRGFIVVVTCYLPAAGIILWSHAGEVPSFARRRIRNTAGM